MVKNTFMRFIYNNTVFNTVQVEFGTYYLFVLHAVLSCPFYWRQSQLF